MLKVKYANLGPGQKETHAVRIDDTRYPYEFEGDKFTEMKDDEHGRRFAAADPAFIVIDEKGGRVMPKKAESGEGQFVLQPGEVVAHLEELTNAALAERARRINGGEKFNQSTKKADLVAFLIENNEVAPISDPGVEEDDGEPATEDSDGEVGNLQEALAQVSEG